MTIVAVVAEARDRYCLASMSPAFAHFWTSIIVVISLFICMFSLINMYRGLKFDPLVAPNRPLLQFCALKLIIFLNVIQSFIISILISSGAVHPSNVMTLVDLEIGIPVMLICFEMACISVLNLFAFRWGRYRMKENLLEPGKDGAKPTYRGGFLGWRALVGAMFPFDLIRGIFSSTKWVFHDRKSRRTYNSLPPLTTQRNSRNTEYSNAYDSDARYTTTAPPSYYQEERIGGFPTRPATVV